MTLSGILSSPSQRRSFLLASTAVLCLCTIAVLAIAHFAPSTPIWSAINNLLISVVASGVFALVSGLYISYFFVDPNDIAAGSVLLPQDVGQALEAIVTKAADYKIFVRTGRHFRAEVLPMLVKQARKARRPIRVEVVLLDFRDKSVCERYADYRKAASFDRQLWDIHYVQKEVMATILALIQASRDNRGLVDIHLFLSKRLSIFRIEGSSDEILVTREDPTDTASRYCRAHRDFSAFVTDSVGYAMKLAALQKKRREFCRRPFKRCLARPPSLRTLKVQPHRQLALHLLMFADLGFPLTLDYVRVAPVSILRTALKAWMQEQNPISLVHPHGFYVVLLSRTEAEEWRFHFWPQGTRTIAGMPAFIHTHDRHVESRILQGQLTNIFYDVPTVLVGGQPLYEVSYGGDRYSSATSNFLQQTSTRVQPIVSSATP
jgi:hypothetical protein